MRDVRCHAPHGSQAFGADESVFALFDGRCHGVKFTRQVADLVARGDPGAPGIVAAGNLSGVLAQHIQGSQGSHHDQRRPHGDQQAKSTQRKSNLDGAALIVGQLLGDLLSLAAQIVLEPMKPAEQVGQTAVGFVAIARGQFATAQRGRGAHHAGVQLADVALVAGEFLAPRWVGFLLEIAIDGIQRILQILPRGRDAVLRCHAAGQAERRARSLRGPHLGEILQRAQRSVDRDLNLEAALIGRELLPPSPEIEQREQAAGRKHSEENGIRNEYLGRHAEPHRANTLTQAQRARWVGPAQTTSRPH